MWKNLDNTLPAVNVCLENSNAD